MGGWYHRLDGQNMAWRKSMKALWLNDALTIRPDDEEERAALAAMLTMMERGGMAPEEAPSTGYATEAD